MRPFTYVSAASITETLELLGQAGNGTQPGTDVSGPDIDTRLLAGGTDLLPLMKAHVAAPNRLVDIKRLDELPRGIRADRLGGNGHGPESGGATLGALTTLSEIETSRLIQTRYTALAQAAALAATPQLRNMATLGGNLLQRPRCWYFRHELFHCWLKGGEECHAYDGQNEQHALFGGGPCYAAHPSDLPAALLALDAEVRLQGPAGERTVPLADFYALPEAARRQETRLTADELILSVRLPALPEGADSTYLKAMDRKVWAFALAGVAAMLQVLQGRIAAARLVLSGVAPIPWHVPAAETHLIGHTPSAALFAEAAEIALAGAEPLAHNGYKIPLARSLIEQALTTLAGSPA
jgi:xanthine dehydrogenase YagS FAD-binding subunit